MLRGEVASQFSPDILAVRALSWDLDVDVRVFGVKVEETYIRW